MYKYYILYIILKGYLNRIKLCIAYIWEHWEHGRNRDQQQ